ncbi:MAG TPA: emp24/gp25L/p24 family protein [Candidatus Diapherotrites archaeon]|uniref:Emp24/gp25L/p24 family protein n=1 Tax=Candidatus Iainarchaeum sp. TaxID=3101447 RepID=A0A7J4JIJ0_9ARCH|nr:hypothetical protein [Candidatus Diapherotrites archaeon]HIH16419.1 emp24/gp25L/p24 family protein [Candidatus Diapherotrites archaeon]
MRLHLLLPLALLLVPLAFAKEQVCGVTNYQLLVSIGYDLSRMPDYTKALNLSTASPTPPFPVGHDTNLCLQWKTRLEAQGLSTMDLNCSFPFWDKSPTERYAADAFCVVKETQSEKECITSSESPWFANENDKYLGVAETVFGVSASTGGSSYGSGAIVVIGTTQNDYFGRLTVPSPNKWYEVPLDKSKKFSQQLINIGGLFSSPRFFVKEYGGNQVIFAFDETSSERTDRLVLYTNLPSPPFSRPLNSCDGGNNDVLNAIRLAQWQGFLQYYSDYFLQKRYQCLAGAVPGLDIKASTAGDCNAYWPEALAAKEQDGNFTMNSIDVELKAFHRQRNLLEDFRDGELTQFARFIAHVKTRIEASDLPEEYKNYLANTFMGNEFKHATDLFLDYGEKVRNKLSKIRERIDELELEKGRLLEEKHQKEDQNFQEAQNQKVVWATAYFSVLTIVISLVVGALQTIHTVSWQDAQRNVFSWNSVRTFRPRLAKWRKKIKEWFNRNAAKV